MMNLDGLQDNWQAEPAEFDYPAHAPEWISAGSALICSVCGMVALGPDVVPAGSPVPAAVFRGGPALDDEDEELYRQEKWS